MAKTKNGAKTEEVLTLLNREFFNNDKVNDCMKIIKMLNAEQVIELYNENITSAFEKLMEDIDLVTSVVDLFKNNLNVSETSRDAYLHRNTLLYRLDKIQKLTGLNIKNFEDAVTFKMLLVIYYERKKIIK